MGVASLMPQIGRADPLEKATIQVLSGSTLLKVFNHGWTRIHTDFLIYPRFLSDFLS
jgi:hypothetical protein